MSAFSCFPALLLCSLSSLLSQLGCSALSARLSLLSQLVCSALSARLSLLSRPFALSALCSLSSALFPVLSRLSSALSSDHCRCFSSAEDSRTRRGVVRRSRTGITRFWRPCAGTCRRARAHGLLLPRSRARTPPQHEDRHCGNRRGRYRRRVAAEPRARGRHVREGRLHWRPHAHHRRPRQERRYRVQSTPWRCKCAGDPC